MEENSPYDFKPDMFGFEEHRRVARILSKIKINFSMKGDTTGRWMRVSTKDFSIGGLSFVYTDYMPPATLLDIRIMLPRLTHEIQVDGEILRVDDLGLRGYFYAIKFLNITDEIKDIIKHRIELLDINKLLNVVIAKGGSDLHLCVDSLPLMRVAGRLVKLDTEPLCREDLEDMLFNILSDEQIKLLLDELELDSSYDLSHLERFRFNVHFQRGNLEATFRRIHTECKSIEELGLPEIVQKFALSKSGLVIITGRTNNGKTTTAAAMIKLINENRDAVIVTVEDPIEYIYTNDKSIVKQREVGLDTKSFASAAQHALRQDLDVLFIGEILDPDTLLVALRAAEVGHLVIITYPAYDAVQAVQRMIFSVPPHLQGQVKAQLSNTLLGIIAQRLYPSLQSQQKRVVATEVLVNTTAVAKGIRDCNFSVIKDAIQTGAVLGMNTMRSSVEELCNNKLIAPHHLKDLEEEDRADLSRQSKASNIF